MVSGGPMMVSYRLRMYLIKLYWYGEFFDVSKCLLILWVKSFCYLVFYSAFCLSNSSKHYGSEDFEQIPFPGNNFHSKFQSLFVFDFIKQNISSSKDTYHYLLTCIHALPTTLWASCSPQINVKMWWSLVRTGSIQSVRSSM